ncbi:hypothetical protein EDEG_01153 [Edhazardia aedis USNM 41457]|uniref:Uncharacterized protein n=1 Tax=Edhazardia aedis (strain USNM 41457) TaxID=1003232 RepID=J9DA89_EDHAE|nr:hypothetical protein EDEG_01153 [Edhazardia aedis USNM 41457]|eukprot:EJW04646.1 hypothetical protein EDEG_01153 [Edhazardia aedis USNM 41457]
MLNIRLALFLVFKLSSNSEVNESETSKNDKFVLAENNVNNIIESVEVPFFINHSFPSKSGLFLDCEYSVLSRDDTSDKINFSQTPIRYDVDLFLNLDAYFLKLTKRESLEHFNELFDLKDNKNLPNGKDQEIINNLTKLFNNTSIFSIIGEPDKLFKLFLRKITNFDNLEIELIFILEYENNRKKKCKVVIKPCVRFLFDDEDAILSIPEMIICKDGCEYTFFPNFFNECPQNSIKSTVREEYFAQKINDEEIQKPNYVVKRVIRKKILTKLENKNSEYNICSIFTKSICILVIGMIITYYLQCSI